ncbi:type III pantothenate kinase [Salinisphaera sp. USBA-960]|uniref:type III pantothenate kinase n=1 Tax=Salinisphaera orenii TaxID=856731 RepID=UPI000DBE3497|nr:type III pantothenate kinase [Salifodinibacter halophilus]NNC27251.1 type III pantothenate kinase [Salifodinibacter halophilus]
MNLLIDVGNSRAKWALSTGRTVHATDCSERSGDWLSRLPIDQASSVWLASVAASDVADAVVARAADAGIDCRRLRSESRFGALENGYSVPGQLGVDRWMACVAAVARFKGSILIVDTGTALTLDWIGADCRHQGGFITPGIGTMRQRLCGATQLDLPAEQDVLNIPGVASSQAIERGTRLSAVSLVDAMAHQYPTDKRLLTGGEASLIQPHLADEWQCVPDLVLQGIAEYASAGDQSSATTTGFVAHQASE